MSVTIKKIALISGVSRGTVDRVLNNRGSVKPDVAERVRQTAQQLGYRPNRAGRVLAARKNPATIGAILPSCVNPFFHDVVEGIEFAQRELEDYAVSVSIHHLKGYDVEEQLRLIDWLAYEEKVNAIVLVPINHPDIATKINQIMDRGIPVVTCNSDIENSHRLCYIGADYLKGGETAAGMLGLFTSGTANVGIITGSVKMLGHNQRITGFNTVRRSIYPGINVVDIMENDDDDFKSYECVKSMMSAHPELTALYLTAGGVYGACRAVKELRLAGKVRIICFDDVPSTRELVRDGTISATICQQPFKQGRLPISILFDYLLDGIPPEQENVFTDTIVKIRENI